MNNIEDCRDGNPEDCLDTGLDDCRDTTFELASLSLLEETLESLCRSYPHGVSQHQTTKTASCVDKHEPKATADLKPSHSHEPWEYGHLDAHGSRHPQIHLGKVELQSKITKRHEIQSKAQPFAP